MAPPGPSDSYLKGTSMPPKKKTEDESTPDQVNPAEAAVAEVLGKDVEYEFRGEKFTVPADIQKSARVVVAAVSGEQAKLIYELLIRADEGRMMRLAKPMEDYTDFIIELYEAYDKAVGTLTTPAGLR
jgi:hypothetical protein